MHAVKCVNEENQAKCEKVNRALELLNRDATWAEKTIKWFHRITVLKALTQFAMVPTTMRKL